MYDKHTKSSPFFLVLQHYITNISINLPDSARSPCNTGHMVFTTHFVLVDIKFNDTFFFCLHFEYCTFRNNLRDSTAAVISVITVSVFILMRVCILSQLIKCRIQACIEAAIRRSSYQQSLGLLITPDTEHDACLGPQGCTRSRQPCLLLPL